MTSTNFWDFVTPSPPLFANSTFSSNFWGIFLTLFPFCADIIYGSPLKGHFFLSLQNPQRAIHTLSIFSATFCLSTLLSSLPRWQMTESRQRPFLIFAPRKQQLLVGQTSTPEAKLELSSGGSINEWQVNHAPMMMMIQ